MKKIEPRVTAGVFGVLDPAKSAASRRSFGGTAPEKVREAAETWLKTLESEGSSG
jgi:argininosuccinate lyase